MVYAINPSKRVIKYLKKLKDRWLKEIFLDKNYGEIAHDPYSGTQKHGDLKGFFAYGFQYNKTDYRIAYTINGAGEVVVVILAGSHEKFYEQLKRLVN